MDIKDIIIDYLVHNIKDNHYFCYFYDIKKVLLKEKIEYYVLNIKEKLRECIMKIKRIYIMF